MLWPKSPPRVNPIGTVIHYTNCLCYVSAFPFPYLSSFFVTIPPLLFLFHGSWHQPGRGGGILNIYTLTSTPAPEMDRKAICFRCTNMSVFLMRLLDVCVKRGPIPRWLLAGPL